jgi:hypothetical protein
VRQRRAHELGAGVSILIFVSIYRNSSHLGVEFVYDTWRRVRVVVGSGITVMEGATFFRDGRLYVGIGGIGA